MSKLEQGLRSGPVVELDPARTVFTRFIPPRSAADVGGAWHRYFVKWNMMTGDKLEPGLIDLMAELDRFVPPAKVEDKPVMSVWHGSLHARLRSADIETLIITGAESAIQAHWCAIGTFAHRRRLASDHYRRQVLVVTSIKVRGRR